MMRITIRQTVDQEDLDRVLCQDAGKEFADLCNENNGISSDPKMHPN